MAIPQITASMPVGFNFKAHRPTGALHFSGKDLGQIAEDLRRSGEDLGQSAEELRQNFSGIRKNLIAALVLTIVALGVEVGAPLIRAFHAGRKSTAAADHIKAPAHRDPRPLGRPTR
jgi:hypothetical protein